MIVDRISELNRLYRDLAPGDIVRGIVPSRHLKETMLVDLLERGIVCYPSALSQILSQSKSAQAHLLAEWMPSHTTVIQRRTDLMAAISRYNRAGIKQVVTKEDGKHCGYGVRRWDNIEALYNGLAFAKDAFPFVLQPFVENRLDLRVIIAGDYVEAYARHNPDNFRMNIAAGGTSRPYDVEDNQLAICRAVMSRGKFPYAHIDLQIGKDDVCFLAEIALNGGIRSARISARELAQRKKAVIDQLVKAAD